MKTSLQLIFILAVAIFTVMGCKKSEASGQVDTSGTLLDTKIEKTISNKDNTASMKIKVEGLRYVNNLTGILEYNCDIHFEAVSGPLFAVKFHYKFRRWPSNYTDAGGFSLVQPANGFYPPTFDPNVFPSIGIYEFPTDPGPLDVFEVTLP